MTSGELVFTIILVVTAAAMAGLWLTMRPPKTSENPVEAGVELEAQPPTRRQRLQRAEPREQTRPKPQRQAQTQQQSQAKTVARPQTGQQREEGGVQSSSGGGGEARASGEAQQRAIVGLVDSETQERLEETLRLYADLLQEMERLKKRLGEKLS
ncbi:MAG: hypothetical protein RMJ28_07115 [Nitrososphaerota archaeon]|nr:hypothetical protein [Candidatus Calditenuaceae archaeon]MDW8073984.1 hypothetical protein [Nitrososphaerota archaeon]